MKKIFDIVFIIIAIIAKQSYSQGTWTQKADFPGTARQDAFGFSIGTKGYLGSGVDNTTPYPWDLWEWEQSTNVWTLKNGWGGRGGPVSFSIGNKGYMGTGYNAYSTPSLKKDFWEWDQSTTVWTQKANFGGTARSGAVGFSIGTNGYIACGSDKDSLRTDFWEWDQTTDIWTQKANFGGIAREYAIGFSIGTKGYIGVGIDGASASLGDFWEWDQITNTWTQKANFGGAGKFSSVGFSIDTKGYIGTGNYTKDFWEWDQSTDTWSQALNFGGTGRSDAVGLSIGTKGYIGTGNNLSGGQKDFWENSPATTSISENKFENSISMSPNPSKGDFTVSGLQYPAQIQIYDIKGEKIFETTSNEKQETIHLREPSGVYFIHISSDHKTAIKKLIIQ